MVHSSDSELYDDYHFADLEPGSATLKKIVIPFSKDFASREDEIKRAIDAITASPDVHAVTVNEHGTMLIVTPIKEATEAAILKVIKPYQGNEWPAKAEGVNAEK